MNKYSDDIGLEIQSIGNKQTVIITNFRTGNYWEAQYVEGRISKFKRFHTSSEENDEIEKTAMLILACDAVTSITNYQRRSKSMNWK